MLSERGEWQTIKFYGMLKRKQKLVLDSILNNHCFMNNLQKKQFSFFGLNIIWLFFSKKRTYHHLISREETIRRENRGREK